MSRAFSVQATCDACGTFSDTTQPKVDVTGSHACFSALFHTYSGAQSKTLSICKIYLFYGEHLYLCILFQLKTKRRRRRNSRTKNRMACLPKQLLSLSCASTGPRDTGSSPVSMMALSQTEVKWIFKHQEVLGFCEPLIRSCQMLYLVERTQVFLMRNETRENTCISKFMLLIILE